MTPPITTHEPPSEVNRYDESYSVQEHWQEAVRHLRSGLLTLIS